MRGKSYGSLSAAGFGRHGFIGPVKYFNLFGTTSSPLHCGGMSRSNRCCLVLLALIFCAGRIFAASSDEERAFGVPMEMFRAHFWDLAETNFGEFAQKYPNSARVP